MNEGLNIADIQLALDYQRAAKHGDRDVTQVAQQAHTGHDHCRQELGTPGAVIEGVVQFFEAGDAGFFSIEGFKDNVPAIHFFHMSIDMTQVFLLAAVIALRFANDKPNQDHGKRYHGKPNDGHRNIDTQHHDQDTDHTGYRSDDLRKTLIEGLVDRVYIICDPR